MASNKYEVNLNLLINNFKNASSLFETDNLSALIFGDEAKKLISNVIFVPKDTEKIQSTLDKILLCSKAQLLGCDDPAGSSLKKFTNLKLNATFLKTMSAQKLSTRLATVKNNETLSVPLDGVNIKLELRLPFFEGNKSLEDSLTLQMNEIKEKIKSSTIENNDSTFSISADKKGSSLKTLSKNWKKDSPTIPTFVCRPKSGVDDLAFKLDNTDLNPGKTAISEISLIFRTSIDVSDSELHELICKQFENVLIQLKALFISKNGLFETDCSTYWLPNYNDFIYVALPKDSRDELAEDLAKLFNLSNSKIVFAENKSVKLSQSPLKDPNLLVNPHEFLKVNPIGQVGIVHGLYHYHHYMQDNFDDSGWGCAYRSFQSVCSWLKQQRHIDKPIPTHKEIQQCLVDIGDKPASFVGSKKWIGSTELSFCLETMFGINSKILTTNSGAEIREHARQLLYHFENYGGPVMIGGGQLAHTILGIDYNTKTGDCRYLILDPHFTGDENLSEILAGGWCGWKEGVSFWKKSEFYNLLLPLTAPLI